MEKYEELNKIGILTTTVETEQETMEKHEGKLKEVFESGRF